MTRDGTHHEDQGQRNNICGQSKPARNCDIPEEPYDPPCAREEPLLGTYSVMLTFAGWVVFIAGMFLDIRRTGEEVVLCLMLASFTSSLVYSLKAINRRSGGYIGLVGSIFSLAFFVFLIKLAYEMRRYGPLGL